MKGTNERVNMQNPKYHDYQNHVMKQREIRENFKNNIDYNDNRDYKTDSNFHGNKEKYYNNQDAMYHMTRAQLNGVIRYFVQRERGEKPPRKGVMKLYHGIVTVLGTILFWLLALTGICDVIKILL